jgi:hypothetical protein
MRKNFFLGVNYLTLHTDFMNEHGGAFNRRFAKRRRASIPDSNPRSPVRELRRRF